MVSEAKTFRFEILARDKKNGARAGVFHTPHGSVCTPAFVPVATRAAIKTLTTEQVRKIGLEMVLANTYHLHLRPGAEIIAELGGLHGFMNWNGPVMTDSGGYQVFSLGFGMEHRVGKVGNIFPNEGEGTVPVEREATSKKIGTENVFPICKNKLAVIDEDGVVFRSHLDGSVCRITPEKSIEIQEKLGADIIFAFDECTSPLHDREYTRAAMERTHRWAKRCLLAKKRKDQALFGIVQGGEFRDFRQESACHIAGLGFPGFGIGGALGKTKADMKRVLEWTVPLLPEDKPRHLLGIGDIEDIFECVERGIDFFDCVSPTRLARRGVLLAKEERKVRLKNAKYARDNTPPVHGCACCTCQNFSRAYLRHLFKTGELLGLILATVHNLTFMSNLMKGIRAAITEGKFQEYKEEFLPQMRRFK